MQKNNLKCAPGKEFSNDSCMSLNVLIGMAEAHNKECYENNTTDKLIDMHHSYAVYNASKYKKYLVAKFSKLYSDECDDQQCLIKQPFVKRMNKAQQEELTEFTFRPEGPTGRFDWLSTTNINDVMKQYENTHTNFKFLGAVPIDFDDIKELGISKLDLSDLLKNNINKLGIVFNLDESWKSGSHWVASYADLENGYIYFFDSYGVPPEKRIRKLMRRIAKFMQKELKIKPVADYNRVRHQFEGSECGVYSINFILRMLDGEPFDDI